MKAAAIDLRSDTVTKPTAAMRAAMASAEVGDDVYGDDPTVRKLEERVAALLGKEAALYVPSGSMANQIALAIHTRPGDDVLIGQGAHLYYYESGAAGALAGVQTTELGRGGLFCAADVEAAYKENNHHHSPTTLVCLENTHNRGGGRIWQQAEVAAVQAAARKLDLKVHLDGARLWNAAVVTAARAGSSPAAQAEASGEILRELAAGFDTVCVCFSKGLGAPVGSAIAGSRELIRAAHRRRKMLGGGMRQAGILAAGALHALDHHVGRLAEDHKNAARFAEIVARAQGVKVVGPVDTNIVVADVACDAKWLVAQAKERGLLMNAMGQRQVRWVTHLDVSESQVVRAAEIVGELVSAA